MRVTARAHAITLATVVGVALALAVAGPRAARAGLSIDRFPDMEPCAEAATYPESDRSPEARRALRRCRLAVMERTLMEERQQALATQAKEKDQQVKAWMERESIPARIMRRNAVDGYLSGGVTNYGLALAGVFGTWLEAEAWIGWGRGDYYGNFSVDSFGQIAEDRRCLGGRAKWLLLERRSLTPFLGAGVAGCTASLQMYNSFVNGGSGFVGGNGTAHAITPSGGVTWTHAGGFRMSLEYIYIRAFYVQASRDEENDPHDPALRDAFSSSLSDDRHAVRFQVGYAF